MIVTELAIKRHVAMWVLIVLILYVGFSAYSTLPRESAPDITIPYIFVATPYFGVSPSDIEVLVTQPIEKELKGIKDVKEITSTSSEGMSSITVEFEPDIVIDDALQKVRDKVDQAKSELPDDVEEPIIAEINFSEFPIMTVNVAGSGGLVQLKEIAEDLQDKLETVRGVLDIKLTGGLEREVKINVDPERLRYYNLSFDDVINSIKNENVNIPGGTIDIGMYKYLVRVPGEFETTDIINNLVVSSYNNRPVYVQDVAAVKYGFKDRNSYARQEQVECVSLSISKRSGENILQVASDIKAELRQFEQTLPEGVSITITGDRAVDVQTMVDDLDNNVITGLLLVVMVLLIFLNWRMALIVATAIPMSMLITFFLIQTIGWTLNFLVLFSLILALGMLVDDAIVVCENIYRHVEEGYPLIEAARIGTIEVAIPVITSTLTIMGAFVPLAFWPGIVGEFMRYLPITVIIALMASMFVALTINPMLSSRFLRINPRHVRQSYMDMKPEELPPLMRHYRRLIEFTLARPVLTLFSTLLIMIVVILLFVKFNAGVVFFPEIEPRKIYVNVETPTGSNLEYTDEITRIIEDRLVEFKDIDIFVANVGLSNNDFSATDAGPANKAVVSIDMIDREERSQSSFKTLEDIRARMQDIAGATIDIQKEEEGPPTGPPINIEVSGDDFDKLGQISEDIRRSIREVNGVVNLKDDFVSGRPELKVYVDREKATIYGLSTAQVANTLRTAINGSDASKYRVGEDEYDITVRVAENRRQFVDDLQEIYLAAEGGKQIPLSALSRIEMAGGLGSIQRKDLKRVVTVSADVEGRNANEALAEVQDVLKDYQLPNGYSMSYTGESEDQAEAAAFLSRAFITALLLIVFVLVAEFNTIKVPVLVMSGIVLSIVGVLIGLLVTGTPFGIIMTGIGVISLAGVVVRNGIVLLDYVLILRERGVDRFESLVVSSMTRFRPVFLTAFTTILGLIPTAIGVSFDFKNWRWSIGGESTQWWSPLAISVISGLTFATVLTLIILPIMFYSWENSQMAMSRWLRRLFGKSEKSEQSA